MESIPAIEINSLSKVYQSRSKKPIHAVDNLKLNIDTGQIFGFLGPNGAGKTTTIKMICGLIKPTTGWIKLNGFHVEKQRGKVMRQIGAVLEGTRNIYWRLSALENVMYFGRLKGVDPKPLRQRAEQLLRELDLWQRRNDKTRTFSRGMQQKVSIACALISDPSVILLDEPTLGLDVQAAAIVKEWIAKLAQQRNKTIILTTHRLDMAQELCDRVAIIHQGKLLTNLPTKELLSLFPTDNYEIAVRGHLNDHMSRLATLLTMRHETIDVTVLSCAIHSQDDLYDTLNQLREFDIPVISVMPATPSLEEIFVEYINKEIKT